MRRQPAVLAFLAASVLLAGCAKDDPCSNENLKSGLMGSVQSWYLFPELLPAVNPGDYGTPAALLDALTAPALAQNKDRHWSYITTLAAQQSYYYSGTSVGFGVSILRRGSQLFVSQVQAGSPAAGAGFLRGDEIVAIGEAVPLTPISTIVANNPADPDGAIAQAFGPATVGLTRLFEVIPRGASAPAISRTMAKTVYALEPVPPVAVFDPTGTGTPKVGYVALRSFISTADAALDAAFGQLKAANVTDVIVDLRYNGGGLLPTADLLTDLLGGGLDTRTSFRLTFNAARSLNDETHTFLSRTSSLSPAHVAFLVTGQSASASELVPNALEPWKQVALVGHQTYGKPVGQLSIVNQQCALVLNLVSFRMVNAQGDGDYFGGLPAAGFSGCGVAADDDLTRETWDPLETQTAAALSWITGTPCPAPPVGPLSVTAPVRPPDTYPVPAEPTEAQRHAPGLF